MHFRRNGQWYGASWATKTASQVAAGTDPVTSSVSTSVQFFPTHSNYSSGRGCSVNFGQKPFIFAAPTGFKTLCAANLSDTFGDNDDTNDPNKYFDTRTWIGDSRSPRVVGIKGDFTPDLIWLKNRTTSGRSHYLYDVIRTFASRKELVPNSDVEEGSSGHLTQNHGYVSGVGIGSFTLGSGATNENYTNKLEDHYVSWVWDCGTSATGANNNGSINIDSGDQWVNDAAGFSMTRFVSNGTAGATVGHGLSAAPDFMLIKRTDGTQDWGVYHAGVNSGSSPEDYGLELSDTSAQNDDSGWWNDTAPDSVNITVGRDSRTNGHDGGTYIAYVFAEKQGFSKFGSYTGTGNVDGPFLYCGFQPAWCMLKRTDGTQPWEVFDNKRSTNGGFNELDKSIAVAQKIPQQIMMMLILLVMV